MIVIDGNYIEIRNERKSISEFYDEDFFNISDEIAKKFNCDEFVVDEIFTRYIQPKIALDRIIYNHKDERIFIKNENSVFRDCAIKKGIPLKRKIFYKNIILSKILVLFSALYILIKFCKYDKKMKINDFENVIAIHRAKSHIIKSSFLKIKNSFTDISNRNDCIYRLFKFKEKLIWVLKSISQSYRCLKKYRKIVEQNVGYWSGLDAYRYYSLRIMHTFFYKHVLEKIFSCHNINTLITAKQTDRFAFIEEELCELYKIKLINFSHGIEFSYRLPRCYVGDKFYVAGKGADIVLNNLYSTSKFVYDYDMVSKMYRLDSNNHDRRIIFLTEPSDIEYNRDIIKKIASFLKKFEIKLFIKTHPRDKKSNYKDIDNIEFIDSLSEAVSNNICISRKSTTLLDGIYNSSICAAFLENSSDYVAFKRIPSLHNELIKALYNIEELKQWLIDTGGVK